MPGTAIIFGHRWKVSNEFPGSFDGYTFVSGDRKATRKDDSKQRELSFGGNTKPARYIERSDGPPFDIDADRLKKARLQRLAKAMSLQSQLKPYLKSKRKYDDDPEAKANNSLDTEL